MPIYEYRCGSCGFEKEYLQKVNDAPVAVCPACGSDAYAKLISAAGFQLKGSGWYATDFKNGSKPKSRPEPQTAANESGCAAGSTGSTGSAAEPACPACATD